MKRLTHNSRWNAARMEDLRERCPLKWSVAKELRANGTTYGDLAAFFGVHKNTIIRWMREDVLTERDAQAIIEASQEIAAEKGNRHADR